MSEERLRIRLAKTKTKLDQMDQARMMLEAARVTKKRAELIAKMHKLSQDIKKLRARFLSNLTTEQLCWYESERKQFREEASRRKAEWLLEQKSTAYSEGWRACDDTHAKHVFGDTDFSR